MKNFFKNLLFPTSFKRFLFFFISDILLFSLSLYLSFLLRFEFTIPSSELSKLTKALPLFLLVKVLCFYTFNNYRIIWRYVSLSDLWKLFKAITIAELLLVILIKEFSEFSIFLSNLEGFPRSIFVIDGILTLFFCGTVRISKRVVKEVFMGHTGKKGKNTLIIGAGNIGEMILRDILRQGCKEFYPVGFLDDDERKIGTYLHGVKILGPIKDFKKYVEKLKIEAVIIAITTLGYQTLKKIYSEAKKAGIETIKIIPPIYEFHKPSVSLKSLEDIKIEDLIGRKPVKVNVEVIKKFIKGKTVLITGAGGSIGSEIVIQVCSFEPEKVILFDADETELHNMQHKLKEIFGKMLDKAVFVVGDIRDEIRVKQIFDFYRPHIVFHAAAYKHVPMMEFNPEEAVKVNIFGTYNVAKVSVETGVEKFIMISTDKAVNPTSIMGATKRIAEYICSAFDKMGKTKFISVRFGNVLGSRGSVLPLFMEQLKKGGPLTVTHPEIKRYFMTISEAVSLVLQASAIGKGGEIFILDMGEPVKIVNIAEELIRLHGLEPYKDIEIQFIGLRPGEKLYEELFYSSEEVQKTSYEKIFISKSPLSYSLEEINKMLGEFKNILEKANYSTLSFEIRNLVKKYVPEYESNLPDSGKEGLT